MTNGTDWSNWNPWAPYPTYEAYHAANKAIADVLGWEVGGDATEVAKTYGKGVSTVYTMLPSGTHYVVTWSDETGAALNYSDEAGNITGPVNK
jgi:hypothetical protein